jgi:hypothetical protein
MRYERMTRCARRGGGEKGNISSVGLALTSSSSVRGNLVPAAQAAEKELTQVRLMMMKGFPGIGPCLHHHHHSSSFITAPSPSFITAPSSITRLLS